MTDRQQDPHAASGVDVRAVKFNQGVIATLSLASLALGSAWPLAGLVAVLVAGSIDPRLALFRRAFELALRPALRLPPPAELDDPRPHAAAQRMVASTSALALAAWFAGAAPLATALLLLNTALCLLSILTGLCVGCQVYFQARRLRWLLGALRR